MADCLENLGRILCPAERRYKAAQQLAEVARLEQQLLHLKDSRQRIANQLMQARNQLHTLQQQVSGTDDMQASVRYARHHLDMPEIRRHVEGGKMPTRLALTWEGKVGFVLTDAMQVKKIRFLDGEFRDAGTAEEDRFDADATIATDRAYVQPVTAAEAEIEPRRRRRQHRPLCRHRPFRLPCPP